MPITLNRLSAGEIKAGLLGRDFSARQVLQSCLEQIRRLDPEIHAWVHVDPELAFHQASEVDRKLCHQGRLGGLAGVPVGIKDIFNTKDMPTQMGSPIWKDFAPGNDARVVHYLRMADAALPGKTVTAEFAVHAPGPTGNPHDPRFMPGTSSSGSAAAVAACMVPLALGTQTAGSIIRPASYCGVFGFKPSFGLLPRTGMLKTTDSLDTVGFFARTVEDLALLFDILRVKGQDFPVQEKALHDLARQAKGNHSWRVTVSLGPKVADAEAYAASALLEYAHRLKGTKGFQVRQQELSNNFTQAHDVHATIYDRTLAYYFKHEFEQHTLVSPIMYDTIRRGNEITLEQYKRALDEQCRLAAELDCLFQNDCDILLTLATGGEALKGLDSVDRPDNCLIWTLCGVPVISLPVFTGPHGMPFGAQALARRYNDYLLLNFVRDLRKAELVGDAPYPIPQLLRRN